VRCEHPVSALFGVEPEYVWCSRCGALAQFNEVYEKTWRPPSLMLELTVSEEVRLAQAAHIVALTNTECADCGGILATSCLKCGAFE
jgi:hypothetical protein